MSNVSPPKGALSKLLSPLILRLIRICTVEIIQIVCVTAPVWQQPATIRRLQRNNSLGAHSSPTPLSYNNRPRDKHTHTYKIIFCAKFKEELCRPGGWQRESDSYGTMALSPPPSLCTIYLRGIPPWLLVLLILVIYMIMIGVDALIVGGCAPGIKTNNPRRHVAL